LAREVWRVVIHKEATLEIDTDVTTIEQEVEDNLLYDVDIEYDLLERS
jgi:tetrahydromethanopterin S-methyltransferase subunit B